MKQLVVPVFAYIAKLVLWMALVAGFLALHYWLAPSEVFDFFAWRRALVLAAPVISSLVLLGALFSLLRITEHRLLLRFLLLVIGTLVNVFIFSYWPYARELSPAPMRSKQFEIGSFIDHSSGQRGLVLSTSGDKLVVLEAHRRDGQEFTFIENLVPITDVETGTRYLPGNLDVYIQEIAGFLEDVLTAANRSWLLTLLFSSTAAFVVVGSWALVRLTRWPLFNAVLSAGFLVGMVWLGTFAGTGKIHEFVTAQFPDFVDIVPLMVVLVPTIILVAIPLVMPPFKDWKRQVST